MKSEFQAKFLHNLLKKRENEGFTLIELLVVIIIIGILSAIALPSFLNQANKARESEAKQYTGSMNRAQQAHYLEKVYFTSEISDLGLGIQTDTTNYSYYISDFDADNRLNITVNDTTGAVQVDTTGAPDKAGTNNKLHVGVAAIGAPKTTNTLRAFIGAVDLKTIQAGEGATTVAILCQTEDPNPPADNAITFALATDTDSADVACATANGYEALE